MPKLLSANCMRLRHAKTFYIALLAVLLVSMGIVLNGCRQAAANQYGDFYILDRYYFNLAPMLGVFWAAFSSIFLGTEYSDGTIRNKLIVGHSRSAVYLSNLLVSTAATLAMTTAWLLGGLVGIPFLGLWEMTWGELFAGIGIYVLSAVAMTAILTALQMGVTNKAVSAVLSILLVLVLILCASLLYNALNEPEMSSEMIVTAGGVEIGEPSPNPLYIGGAQRRFYEALMQILPTGQQILIADQAVPSPGLMLAASVGITLAASLGGYWLFRRKNLK